MSVAWYIEFIVFPWLFFGLAFWVDTIRYNGVPTQWKSKPRCNGWGEVIFFWLPFSLVLGPIAWLLLLIFKLKEE